MTAKIIRESSRQEAKRAGSVALVEKRERSAIGRRGDSLRSYVSFVMDDRDAFDDWPDELYEALIA